MKTKFKVEILKDSEPICDLIKMICSHNSGKVNVDLDVLCAYLMAKNSMAGEQIYSIKNLGDNNQTVVFSDKQGEFIKITEIELQELTPYEWMQKYEDSVFFEKLKSNIEILKKINNQCGNK